MAGREIKRYEGTLCPFTNNPCTCGAYDVVGECPNEPRDFSEDFDDADELRLAELTYILDGEHRGRG